MTGRLRQVATMTLLGGAIASLGLMLNSARSTPALLIFLYTGWVLLPFVASAVGARRLGQRGIEASRLMDISALFMTAVALVAYIGAPQLPSPPRPAALFLIVPLVCHVVTAIAYAVAAARPTRASSPMNPPNIPSS